jgi:hypothetical protein
VDRVNRFISVHAAESMRKAVIANAPKFNLRHAVVRAAQNEKLRNELLGLAGCSASSGGFMKSARDVERGRGIARSCERQAAERGASSGGQPRRLWQLPLFAALCLLSSHALCQIVTPRFVVETAGQATFASCQSYALAAALAFKRDARWPINSAHDLRLVEASLRDRIVANAPKGPTGSPMVEHSHILAAFSEYAHGAYVIRQKYYKDIPSLDDGIARRSGVNDAQSVGPGFLLGAVVKDVLVASVTRIGDMRYSQGHLVTFLGVDGPPNSKRRYLVLNSAVKVRGKRTLACQEGVPDEPGPYVGSVSWVPIKDIDFRQDSNGILSWFVEGK